MKVILLKDVNKVGKRFEIKEVSDGHALNFLIPRGEAEIATEGSLKRLEEKRKQDDEKRKIHEDLLIKNLKSVDGIRVEVALPANEQGHLFAGIHKDEVAKLVMEKTNLDISPEYIELEKPIKETGEHVLALKLQDMNAKLTLVVTAQ